MKTKLLRKLRKQAEKKVFVRRKANGIFYIRYSDRYMTTRFELTAIDWCEEERRSYILEKIDRMRPPKRIF